MKKSLLVMAFISLLAMMATAQNEEFDRGEFFAGYSAGSNLEVNIPFQENGFNVAGVYNVHKFVGIKVDVSGTYQSLDGNFYFPNSPKTVQTWKGIHNLYTVNAGVQFKDNRKDSTFKPFGHFLVGYGKHFDTFKTPCPTGAQCPPFDIDLQGVSLVLGGGLDIKLNKRIDIRAAQFDLNPISSRNTGNWYNSRFSAGVIFKF